MYKCYIQILLKQKQNIFIKMKVPNMHNFKVTYMILLSSLNHQLPVSCFYCAQCVTFMMELKPAFQLTE